MSIRKNGSNVDKYEEPTNRLLDELWKLIENIENEAQEKGIIIHDIYRVKEIIGILRNYICK